MRPRVALYGHDTLGLGHVRRNLSLAGSFSELPQRPDVLIVTGAVEATSFELPPRVDVLALPGIAKDGAGAYGSRRLSVGFDALVGLRRAVLTAGLTEFAPDLLVVDKVPLGLARELEPALRQLRRDRPTRIVLGLRDVLDEPAVARAEWRAGRMTEAVRRYFDEIWVYGDPRVHDVIEACAVPPALRAIVRYTGYLSRGRAGTPLRPPMLPADQPFVLCTVGGGGDGVELAAAFAAARRPAGVAGVLVTGPHMTPGERNRIARLAGTRPDFVVVAFSSDVARWIPCAGGVVAMGGANSVAEILATSTPALIVPRCRPRAEQAVRASALAQLGLVDHVRGGEADPAAIERWISDAVGRPRRLRTGIDLDGLATVRTLAERLLVQEDHHALAG